MSADARPFALASVPRYLWLAVILVGATLRFTWNADMEFKGDESWMYDRAVHVGTTETWPAVGMPSGVGLRNPGVSVWLFVGLARLTHATTPLQLDRAVVALNVLALVLLGLFIARSVPEPDREPWLWALALVAVNPIGLVLQRKIWAQSTFPLFCVIFLWGWWRRDRRLGAVLWGIVGGLLGQVHMSGFFMAAAFLVCSAWAAWRDRARPGPRWRWWFLGSLLALAPLVPWIRYVLSGQDHSPPWSWHELTNLNFVRLAFSDVLGLGLDYSLGSRYTEFLHYPDSWSGFYPALYLQGVSFTCGVAIFVFAVVAALRRLRHREATGSTKGVVSDTGLALVAAIPVFGVLITLSGTTIHRHYLHVTYPFEALFLTLLAFRYAPAPRRWLLAIWLAQLGISATFLQFIHANGGAVGGDYGRAYRGN